MFPAAIRTALAGRDLSADEAKAAMGLVLDEMVSPAQIGAWLCALVAKGEAADEVFGCAMAIRERMIPVAWDAPAIDVCGTGGDASNSFNASTAAALIASAAGATVAKCGNRAATSLCGSADLLEALGVCIELGPTEAQTWLRENRFAFLFSQRYHPALRRLAPIRRELGVRTVFNMLGPLCNPACPKRQLVGAADRRLAALLFDVLGMLGVQRTMVVHSLDGLDEFSLAAPTEVYERDGDQVHHYFVDPSEIGLGYAGLESVRGGTPAQNTALLRQLLRGEGGPIRDFCLLNAAAAIVVAGLAADLREGFYLAGLAVDSGAAVALLESLASRSTSALEEVTTYA